MRFRQEGKGISKHSAIVKRELRTQHKRYLYTSLWIRKILNTFKN